MIKKCDVCGKELNIPPFKANRFIACEDCRNLHPEKVTQRKREIAAEKRAEKERYWEDHPEEYKEYLAQRKAKSHASKIAKYGSLEKAEEARQQKQFETLKKKYPDEDWDNITNVSQLSFAKKKISDNMKSNDKAFYKERQEKSNATKIEKYGSLEAAHSSMIEKYKQTNIEKYGVSYAMQNYDVKRRATETFLKKAQEDKNFWEKRSNKSKATKIEKYGSLEAAYDSMRKAYENTCIEKYGAPNTMSIPEISSKVRESFRRRVEEDPEFLKNIKAKTEATKIEKYGSLEKAQEIALSKRKETCKEKYGAEFPAQADSIKVKLKNTLKEKYGDEVENISQILGHADKMRDSVEKDIHKFEEDNNCTGFSRLVRKYGQGWIHLDLPKINYKKYRFIPNEYVSEIEAYVMSCNSQASHSEKDLVAFVKSIYEGPVFENVRNIINPLELDIYVPEKNLAIEYNGDYWHSSECKEKKYHEMKSKMCEAKGIRLIHVYECEWIHSREKIESLLRIALGCDYSKIGARQCEVRKIDNKMAQAFNEKNHLQGHRNAQVTYGLFYKGELQQLMSFSKTKYNRNLKNENDWEIIRGCPGSNNVIVGGVSKLFKSFVKEYNPDTVFSYCDFNKFDGRGYEAIGMKFTGYTGPDKFYVDKSECKIGRNPKKRKELEESCLYIIFGAGSKKYIWRREENAKSN